MYIFLAPRITDIIQYTIQSKRNSYKKCEHNENIVRSVKNTHTDTLTNSLKAQTDVEHALSIRAQIVLIHTFFGREKRDVVA